MLDQKKLTSEALKCASTVRDERPEHWMIVLHASHGSFLQRKKRLTEAFPVFRLGRRMAVPLGTERQGVVARDAITECGKALAGGP
ncbi:hypothetical protein [Arthrobacter sp. ISL-95]|uniref:hypothetical protein n=1 Tax=Arthrobacter sp. ISL-95 TaxID=2819116 RepID=UPI001BE73712|nr:hypothetical protein [Arthrobacter sp. ISL-95]MBT2584907.1 hypothetical protein [Arthrobacter sp. ISL-95]